MVDRLGLDIFKYIHQHTEIFGNVANELAQALLKSLMSLQSGAISYAYMFTCKHVNVFLGISIKVWYPSRMTNKKMFSTRLDVDLIKALKHLSVDIDAPVSELTKEAIQDLLKKYDSEAANGGNNGS